MLINVDFEPLFSKVIQFEADSMKAVFWATNYMLKDYDMIQQLHQLLIPQYTAVDHSTELLIKILIFHLF